MVTPGTNPAAFPLDSSGPGSALKLLSDPTRLRILALLEQEELAVGELTRALDMAQSRVSNHLRLLRAAGMLLTRKVGTSSYLRLAEPQNGARLTGKLWELLREELEVVPQHAADRQRLSGVLAARASDAPGFFDRLAGEWDKLAGAFSTGRARDRAVSHLLPPGFVAADLGCGTGYMGEALVETATRLISVDRSEGMLDAAEKRLRPLAGATTLEFRAGSLDALPIEDGELDGLVAGMVLHHLERLDPAIGEMLRALKPGGTATILELSPHREDWMRRELGDRHLGIPATDVLGAMERAGFRDLVLDPVEDRYRPRPSGASPGDELPSLSLYVVRGRRPPEASPKLESFN